MKTFFKIFLIAFVCFVMAMGAGLWAFTKFYEEPTGVVVSGEGIKDGSSMEIVDSNKEKQEPAEEKSELEKLIEKSNRINVVLWGMEGPRTDTIILASFDPQSKGLDLISIPRDTYYPRKEYGAADKQKLNAVYGDHGAEGTTKAIENILGGVPVHHYVKVTYNGVAKIVDSLGGVKVNVPMDMEYDDPYDNPPLHINLKKGTQVLNGQKAIQFIRFRKGNNGGGYPDGDLGRNRAQQEFVKAAINKALGFRLPVVANTVFKYVKTNMPLTDILLMAKDAIGMTKNDLKTHSLPGKSSTSRGLSYFLHDPDQVEQLMIEIYSQSNE